MTFFVVINWNKTHFPKSSRSFNAAIIKVPNLWITESQTSTVIECRASRIS